MDDCTLNGKFSIGGIDIRKTKNIKSSPHLVSITYHFSEAIMTDEQRAKLMMQHRVHGVITKYVADFPAPHVPDLLAALETNIHDIHAAAAVQEVGTGATTAKRAQERAKLVKMLTRIENTGQVIGAALNDPVIVAQFSLEPAFSQMPDEQLITSADALKTAATPLAAEFQSRGFNAIFLARLQAQRDAFHISLPTTSTVGPTEILVQEIAANDAIIGELDVIVDNVWDADEPADAPKLAEYRFARHVLRVRSQPLTVVLTATRTGNEVTGAVTLSRAVETGDTVLLRWREQGSAGTFTDGPITTLSAGTTTANPSVTVTTASPVEVVARVILSSGGQFDSTVVVV